MAHLNPVEPSIMGSSVTIPEHMAAFVRNINPDAQDIDEIAAAFIDVGENYGVRGDIAFCQSIVETGWFTFKGSAVAPDQFNYCGMGVTSTGIKGNSFSSVREGVTAQIQHLYGYASIEPLPSGERLVDPRFKYVTRGIAPTWLDLNMRWAMNDSYGQHILEKYTDLLDYSSQFTVPQPIEGDKTTPEEPIKTPTNDDKIIPINRPIQDEEKGLFHPIKRLWDKFLNLFN